MAPCSGSDTAGPFVFPSKTILPDKVINPVLKSVDVNSDAFIVPVVVMF